MEILDKTCKKNISFAKFFLYMYKENLKYMKWVFLLEHLLYFF